MLKSLVKNSREKNYQQEKTIKMKMTKPCALEISHNKQAQGEKRGTQKWG